MSEPPTRYTWTPTAVNDVEAYRQALARIAELEANIIEAASAYSLTGTLDSIDVAEVALVRMSHEGAAALRASMQVRECWKCERSATETVYLCERHYEAIA